MQRRLTLGLLASLCLAATACDDDGAAASLDIELYTADLQEDLLEGTGGADTLEMVLVNADAPFGEKQSADLSIASGEAKLKGLKIGQRFRLVVRGFDDAASDNVPQFFGASSIFTVEQDEDATVSVMVGKAECVGLNRSSGRAAIRDPLGKDDQLQKRVGMTANALPDGRILLLGGATVDAEGAVVTVHDTAEIYDPRNAQFIELSGVLSSARAFHTATTLDSGEILVLGGQTEGAVEGVAANAGTASLITVSGNFLVEQPLDAIATDMARSHHTATKLADGSVLFVGGRATDGTLLASTLRYLPSGTGDASAGRLLPQGDLVHPRTGHTSTIIARRHELAVIAGGVGTDGPLDTVEVFTLSADQACQDANETASAERGCFFKRADGRLAQTRWGHAAVPIDGGRNIAFIGGFQSADREQMVTPIEVMSSDLLPQASAAFGALGFGVGDLTATTLDDGSVVVIGGRQGDRPHAVVTRLQPTRGADGALSGFSVTELDTGCELSETRYGHRAVLTEQGTVLVVGGLTGVPGALLAQRRGELFFPRVVDIESLFR